MKSKNNRIQTYLSDKDYNKIILISEKNEIGLSELIRLIIKDYLKKEENEQDIF